MPVIFSGKLKVERLTVAIANLPASLDGIKLIHLTDLHYDGLRLSDKLLGQAIALSNQENPDLVLLTGDYITDDPTPVNELVRHLKHLESRCGIYASLGNHDIYWANAKTEVTNALTRIGIEVLWNAIAYPLGPDLPIVGLADYWSKAFKPESVMNSLNPNTPRIVLSHNPDTAEILQQWRVDLQLAGHTHGGQVVIPGYGSAALLFRSLQNYLPKPIQRWIPWMQESARIMKHWEWALGYHSVGNNRMYVNRGLGTYPPGRLFCPPELTVITLTTDNRNSG
ncbi:MAG: metallophosphoesterase [Chroococcales cyanobacterium]